MKSFKRMLKQKRANRRGATAVEFAVVAPALAIVLVVCVEFSRLSILRNTSQSACYECARLAIAEGAQLDDAFAEARRVLNRMGPVRAHLFVNGSEMVVEGSTVHSYDEEEELDFETQEIVARIEINLSENTFILPGNMFGNTRITSQVSMRTERYKGFFDAEEVD